MAKIISKLPNDSVNSSKSSIILKSFILLTSLAIIVFFISYVVINIFISYNKEKINDICREKLLKQYCNSEFEKESNNVQKLVDELLTYTDYKKDVKTCIYNFQYKNAFASCGDIIIVSKKLYNDAKDINDLGFILAHEISHLTNGDSLQNLSKVLSQVIVTTLFSLSLDSEISKFISSQTEFNSNFYTRKQELRADRTAIKIIKRKYDDIYLTLKFFENLLKETEFIKDNVSIIDYYFKNKSFNKKDTHNFLSTYMNHFGTHPAYQRRMESIIEAIKDNREK